MKHDCLDDLDSLDDLDEDESEEINDISESEDHKEISVKEVHKIEHTISEQSERRGFDQLNELIGLSSVKEQVRKISAFARMQEDIKSSGKEAAPITLNMAFLGNPGTAKTTVARIVARIFKEVGLLKCGELIEVGRADLIGKYEGQTANKVKELFEKAKGDLLFIDEAYSLIEDWDNAYGDEAINTIVQEMENRRDDTIVIFAGYPDKMEEFMNRNPGLRSRVPFSISFPDYSPEELLEIAKYTANKKGFEISTEAGEKIMYICEGIKGSLICEVRYRMKQLTKDDIQKSSDITVLHNQMLVELPDEKLPYSISAGDTLWVQDVRMWDDREYEDLIGIAKHPTPEEALQLLIKWGSFEE